MAEKGATAVVIGALSVLSAPYAHAQSISEDPLEQQPGVHVGARVRIAYDTNLLRLADNVVAPADRSKDDVVTSAAVTARARLTPSMQKIAVTGEYGRDFYAKNGFLNRERVAVDGRWDWKFGPRCSGDAQAAYARAQGDLAEQTSLVANARAIFTVSASGGCEVALGWKPAFYVRKTDVSNSNPAQAGADSRQFAYGAGLAYRRTRTAGIELGYRKVEVTYPNRFDPVTGDRSHVSIDAVLGRLDFRLANRLSLGLSGAHYWISGEGGRNYRSFAGGVELAADINPKFHVQLQAARDIRVPNFVLASFVVNDRIEAGGTYRLSPKTRLGVRGGYERNRFRSPRPSPSGDLRTYDAQKYVVVEASYRPIRPLGINLRFQHTDRNTDSAFGSYAGTQVLLEAILQI
jgi:hypothetical protein